MSKLARLRVFLHNVVETDVCLITIENVHDNQGTENFLYNQEQFV